MCRLKALLAAHSFDTDADSAKAERLRLLLDGQQDCIQEGSYRVRAKQTSNRSSDPGDFAAAPLKSLEIHS
jgi:hypothetical protein